MIDENHPQIAEGPSHPGLLASFGMIILGFLSGGLVTAVLAGAFPSLQLLVGELVIIMPALIYISRKGYDLKAVFRINPVDKRVIMASIALGLALTVLLDEVDRLVSTFVKMPPELQEIVEGLLLAESALDWVLLFLAGVFLAGIVEEMLFRGLLLKALELRMEFLYAIFVSALTFAFFHLMPWLIQILLIGIVLGLLAWRSNSVVPGIIVHAINNAFAIIYLNLDQESLTWYNWQDHVYPPLVVISAAVTFYAIKWFFKLTGDEPTESVSA